MSKLWYVAIIQPHMEGPAQCNIRRLGFPCVWLKFRNQVIRHGRHVDTFSSLFPGYLFVALGPSDQWWPITRERGVNGLIMRDEFPAALPEKVAKDLFARADSAGNIHVTHERKRRPSYKPGSEVRVTAGAFEGFTAQFVGRTAEERVQVLLSIFGGHRPVHLDENQIEAA